MATSPWKRSNPIPSRAPSPSAVMAPGTRRRCRNLGTKKSPVRTRRYWISTDTATGSVIGDSLAGPSTQPHRPAAMKADAPDVRDVPLLVKPIAP